MTAATDSPQTRPALTEAALGVVPLLRREADAADRHRRLTSAATDALRAAGLFRLGAPRAFGGHEAGMAATLEVTSVVGVGCASSAWVLTLTHANQHIAASFGSEVREELWSGGTDFGMCGSFTGQQLAGTEVDGGQVVSGRWPMASGAHQARWAVVAVGIADTNAVIVDRGLALIPMSDLRIEDTWNMIGMRGTGSHTLIADEVLVPTRRIRRLSEVLAGPPSQVEPLYRIPLGSLSLMFLGPMVGSVQAAFNAVMEAVAGGKPLAMSNYARVADSPSGQSALADAATYLDTARLHLHRSAAMLDETAAAGSSFDTVERARVRMDAGYASACLGKAMESLLSVAGASGMTLASEVQRHWRDLHTAARQPTINAGLCREIYGRALVGNSEQVSFVV